MQLKEIHDLADGLAPFALSDEYCARYGAYDNSGILADCGREVCGVLFSLDLSSAAVEKAKQVGANVIFTHHPAIYSPIKALPADSPLMKAVSAGISVISAHLNLDCAQGGIDESLMCALGGQECAVMHPLTGGGYGRVYPVQTDTQALLATIKDKISAQRIVVYGTNRPISRIASFCGAGLDEGTLAFAKAQGADVLVSSDAKHHLIAQAIEQGMDVILLTHYAAENYGFQLFYEKMKKGLNVPCEYFTDGRLL